ncbi:hypothetical protein BDV37DRAFT_284553 [Aspergillus pseudonomiae]|uniref:Uncharacterized protein n=1 Tax=Aspergillus pseudonomiae TaxID=1506151 RepID=A0A5N7D840_9EURO|nr:uncharacterized protein BDV37DRAFT_284553 [Aspergillus pseudonomiae]KAE8402581.1 hypothetical protein BDV37DRAFT_284553 [Aspergillus pseudonomiae]
MAIAQQPLPLPPQWTCPSDGRPKGTLYQSRDICTTIVFVIVVCPKPRQIPIGGFASQADAFITQQLAHRSDGSRVAVCKLLQQVPRMLVAANNGICKQEWSPGAVLDSPEVEDYSFLTRTPAQEAQRSIQLGTTQFAL